MLPGAIFDMDGLMFDTERYYAIAWERQARRFGVQPDPAFHRAVCGTGREFAFAAIRRYFPDIADPAAFLEAAINDVAAMVRANVPVKPGLPQLLQYLHANGVRMAVASGSDPEVIRSNLRRTGLDHYFAAVFSTSQVAHGKPAPDVFLAAAEAIGRAPEDCYVFEDSNNGTLAGAAAGCTTIMVPDMIPPTDEARSRSAAVCASLLEALKWIRSHEPPENAD